MIIGRFSRKMISVEVMYREMDNNLSIGVILGVMLKVKYLWDF